MRSTSALRSSTHLLPPGCRTFDDVSITSSQDFLGGGLGLHPCDELLQLVVRGLTPPKSVGCSFIHRSMNSQILLNENENEDFLRDSNELKRNTYRNCRCKRAGSKVILLSRTRNRR